MRKSVFCLLAALMVVGLPLSALAGTTVYHVKEQPYPPTVPFNFFIDECNYSGECKYYTCFSYDPNIRNPAWKYQQDICVSFTGVFHETIRVKTKTVTDIDWNLVAHGTGYVHPGLSGEYAMAAAAMAASNPVRLYWAKRPAGLDVLDSGPLQVEEVVQDDGADSLEIPASDSPVELFSMPVAYEKLDYAMYHLKIQGNSILFFRFTLRDGNYCFTDLENGTEICCPGGSYCP